VLRDFDDPGQGPEPQVPGDDVAGDQERQDTEEERGRHRPGVQQPPVGPPDHRAGYFFENSSRIFAPCSGLALSTPAQPASYARSRYCCAVAPSKRMTSMPACCWRLVSSWVSVFQKSFWASSTRPVLVR